MPKHIVLTARVIEVSDNNRLVDFRGADETDSFDKFIEDVSGRIDNLMEQHDAHTCCFHIETTH